MHGRRQLVPWGVLLSQATSETHALSYQRILFWMPGTLRGPPMINRRKEWTTVGPYAPNPLGNTRATMAETMGSDAERRR